MTPSRSPDLHMQASSSHVTMLLLCRVVYVIEWKASFDKITAIKLAELNTLLKYMICA